MADNYKIILDEKKLKQFIDWLPELKMNQTFYCCLFARSKYYPDFKIKSGQSQLRRFTADKNYLFDKIKQLECELGSYTLEGRPVPQEILVLTINPNPRDLWKATEEFSMKLTKVIIKHKNRHFNPHSEIMSEIQTSCISPKPFVHFDFDGVSLDSVINNIKTNDIINMNAVHIINTKGGFHVLIRVSEVEENYTKSWYKKLCNIPGLDKKAIKGDSLMPIPGCTQAGYTPYLINATNKEIIDISGSVTETKLIS